MLEKTMKQALPWTVAAVLAALLVGVYVHFQGVVRAKDAALEAAESKYQALANESASKLRDAQQRADDANQRTQQVSAEATSQLQALTTEASAKLQAANLPQVPVAVSFRKAMLGSGNVATIRNLSGQSLALTVTALRPDANQQRTFTAVIDANQVKELGHAEGWAFVAGDALQVSLPNHKPVRFAVN